MSQIEADDLQPTPPVAPVETGASVAPAPTQSLRSLAIRGAMWVVGADSMNKALRFGGNLALTRLLTIEVFGLMQLVSSILALTRLFSDVGLKANIVQNEAADDPKFLNTAWTIQVLRGMLLFVAAAIAGAPMSIVYGQPVLKWLVAAAALNMLIGGFSSTNHLTLSRHMRFGLIQVPSIVRQVISLSVMIALAWWYRSVWALVVGTLVGTIVNTILTHVMLPGIRNRFHWDREHARAIWRFGRWIFLSTALVGVTLTSDRLLLGYFTRGHLGLLGVYGQALFISGAIREVFQRISHNILFPAFSRIAREKPEWLSTVLYRARFWLDAALLVGVGALMILGFDLIRLLYPVQFWESGWMLQILCLRVGCHCVANMCEQSLVALGYSRYGALRSFVVMVWMVGGVPLGWYLAGIAGVVWAVALSQVPIVLLMWFLLSRHRLFQPFKELRLVVFLASGLAIGWGIRMLLP